MTADLVQFLRARLDEEALWADNHGQASPRWYYDGFANEVRDHVNDGTVAFVPVPVTARHIARNDPARALAEVEAKRQVLARLAIAEKALSSAGPGTPPHDLMTGAVNSWRQAVQLLALPYADHPKYREEWRP